MTIMLRTLLIMSCLLLIPAIGNQTIEGWNWSLFDFVWAGAMIAGVQFAYHAFAKKINHHTYKMAAALGLGATFILLWINAAVGIVGDDDGINMIFFLSIVITFIVGSLISKGSPRGMAKTLYALAGVTILIPTAGFILSRAVYGKSPEMIKIYALCGMFALLFIGSGLLFRKAAKK